MSDKPSIQYGSFLKKIAAAAGVIAALNTVPGSIDARNNNPIPYSNPSLIEYMNDSVGSNLLVGDEELVAHSDSYVQVIDEFNKKMRHPWPYVYTGEAEAYRDIIDGDSFLVLDVSRGSRLEATLKPNTSVPSEYTKSHLDFQLNIFKQGSQIINDGRVTEVTYPLCVKLDVEHEGGRTETVRFYSANHIPLPYEQVPENKLCNKTISLVDECGKYMQSPVIRQIDLSVNARDSTGHLVAVDAFKVRSYR